MDERRFSAASLRARIQPSSVENGLTRISACSSSRRPNSRHTPALPVNGSNCCLQRLRISYDSCVRSPLDLRRTQIVTIHGCLGNDIFEGPFQPFQLLVILFIAVISCGMPLLAGYFLGSVCGSEETEKALLTLPETSVAWFQQ